VQRALDGRTLLRYQHTAALPLTQAQAPSIGYCAPSIPTNQWPLLTTRGQRHLAKAAQNDPVHTAYTARAAADLSHVTDRLTDRQTPCTSVTIVWIPCIRCRLIKQLPNRHKHISQQECLEIKVEHPMFLLLPSTLKKVKKGKGSPYSITERGVPELIPVLGSQPAGDVSRYPAVGCHYFPPGLQLPPQPLSGLLPIMLLGEQRHNGCEHWTACLRLLPDSVATAIWTHALPSLSPAR